MKILKLMSFTLVILMLISFEGCNTSDNISNNTNESDFSYGTMLDTDASNCAIPPTYVFRSYKDLETFISTGSKDSNDYDTAPNNLESFPSFSECSKCYISLTDLFEISENTVSELEYIQLYAGANYSVIYYETDRWYMESAYYPNNLPDSMNILDRSLEKDIIYDMSDRNSYERCAIVRKVNDMDVLSYSALGSIVGIHFIYKQYVFHIGITGSGSETPEAPDHLAPLFSEDDEVFNPAVMRILNAIDEKVAENEAMAAESEQLNVQP